MSFKALGWVPEWLESWSVQVLSLVLKVKLTSPRSNSWGVKRKRKLTKGQEKELFKEGDLTIGVGKKRV